MRDDLPLLRLCYVDQPCHLGVGPLNGLLECVVLISVSVLKHAEIPHPYVAIMPIGLLCIEKNIHFLCLDSPDPCIASPNCLWIVRNTPVIDQGLCDVFLEVFGVLHAGDHFVVRVKICHDFLGDCRAPSRDL